MSRTYSVELFDSIQAGITTKNVICDDVQIKDATVKFLNGKGASATVVAYYPTHRVLSVEEVK